MTRYEIVRDISDELGVIVQRHPEQPEDGFLKALDALNWCVTPPRDLGGEWYIRPMEE